MGAQEKAYEYALTVWSALSTNADAGAAADTGEHSTQQNSTIPSRDSTTSFRPHTGRGDTKSRSKQCKTTHTYQYRTPGTEIEGKGSACLAACRSICLSSHPPYSPFASDNQQPTIGPNSKRARKSRHQLGYTKTEDGRTTTTTMTTDRTTNFLGKVGTISDQLKACSSCFTAQNHHYMGLRYDTRSGKRAARRTHLESTKKHTMAVRDANKKPPRTTVRCNRPTPPLSLIHI